MKTGEILAKIDKKDISYLVKNLLFLKPNKLSPFIYAEGYDMKPVSGNHVFDNLLNNKESVYCIKELAEPEFCIRVNTAGPGMEYSKYNFCITKESTCVLSVESNDSYGIQYIEKKDELVSYLSDIALNEFDNASGYLFPEDINYELMILFLNLIDAYRYVYYRDALQHKPTGIFKLSISEFNELIKSSSASLDFRWLVSNFIGLIPSAIKKSFIPSEDNYNKLFNEGFLISVKDNNSGGDYLLMNVMSVDAGAEFLNTWYKSTGIELCRLNNGSLINTPFSLVLSTAMNNHRFRFTEGEKIKYNSVDKKLFSEECLNIIENAAKLAESDSKKIRYCGNCGQKNEINANFCRDCGSKLT